MEHLEALSIYPVKSESKQNVSVTKNLCIYLKRIMVSEAQTILSGEK